MPTPQHAVILCGGRGTRLAQVFYGPKLLLPIAGRPLAHWLLDAVAETSIRDVWLLEGHGAAAIREALGDRWGPLRLHHCVEEAPLGTAGCLVASRDVLSGPVLVLYGDVFVSVDLARLLAAHTSSGAACTLVVHPNDHPHDSDQVEIDARGHVVALHPKDQPRPELRNLASAALHVLDSRALDRLAPRPADLFRDLFPRLVADGETVCAYATTEYLKDAGTPTRWTQVDEDVRSGRADARRLDQPRPLAILDRDGVLNREIGGVQDAESLQLLEGVADAVAELNRAGWLVAVATNQPSLAKGWMSEADHEAVRRRLETRLAEAGAWLDGYAHCPHHPDGGFPGERAELKGPCACRKPAPGMLESWLATLPADRSRTWMIGDSWRDIAAARAAGVRCVGIGHAEDAAFVDQEGVRHHADHHAHGLPEAVALLLSETA